MEEKECYYSILKISKTATESEIKKSYYKLAREFHPDKNVNYDDQTKLVREERFKLISEAYEILSNEQSRANYDKYGHEGFKEYEFADAYDMMENFLVGGEVLELYAGKLGSNEEMSQRTQGMSEDQVRKEMKKEHKEEVRKVKVHYQTLFTQFKADRLAFTLKVIQDSVEMCSMPANKPLLKYLGWRIQNIVGQWPKDENVMEYFRANYNSMAGNMSVFSRFTGMISNSISLYVNMSGEIKEMQEIEKLPQEQQVAKQEEVARKLKDKLKENESKMVEIATSYHILKIHSLIEEATDKVLEEVKNKDMAKMVEMFYIIGAIFSNYYDESLFDNIGIQIDNHLKVNNRIYYELKESADTLRFCVIKTNPSDIASIVNGFFSLMDKDNAKVWILIKKTKIEYYHYNTEVLKRKIKYKDAYYIAINDELNSVEVKIKVIEEIRVFKFQDNESFGKFKAYIKDNNIKFKSKTEYEAESNLNKKQNNKGGDVGEGIMVVAKD